MDKYILNDAGEPVSCEDIYEWGKWFQCGDNRRVALDDVGGYRVSTVFLGIDHSWGDGPPVLWETMVFGRGPWDEWQDRYTSLAEAEAGHARVVELIKRGQPPGAD